ncbi:unnamed protein product [Heterobilharzia americana]|nr:unnamed protein product [Heterobilharzia americana]
MEKESDNQLPFLNVLVSRTNAGNPKSTGSQHTLITSSTTIAITQQHTKSVACRLYSKEQEHCSTRTSRRNGKNYLMPMLQKNGYPRNFIRRYLSRTS